MRALDTALGRSAEGRQHAHALHTQQALRDLAALEKSGIDLAQMTRELEEEGVKKFTASYDQLLAGIAAKSEALVGKG